MTIFNWLKRLLLGLFILIISLTIIGLIYEQVARSAAEKIAPHGAFADVGGHQLHYYKTGNSGPTVVFESAFDQAGHLQWYNLQQEASKFATTISMIARVYYGVSGETTLKQEAPWQMS